MQVRAWSMMQAGTYIRRLPRFARVPMLGRSRYAAACARHQYRCL